MSLSTVDSRITRFVVRIKVGFAWAQVASDHLERVQEELREMRAEGDPDASTTLMRIDPTRSRHGNRADLLTFDEMRAVAKAVDRLRRARPEWDFDLDWWDLNNLRRACELVASGASRRETARWMAKQRRVRWEQRRELRHRAFEADRPARRTVFAYGAVLTAITGFLIWGLVKEIHSTDKASKPFWLALTCILLVIVGFPLFSGFMARTYMEEPWVPVYRFLDTMRINLSLAAGLVTFLVVRSTANGAGSLEYYRTAAELIALLAIALAVEARFSAAATSDLPFRGVAVFFGFVAITYGGYICLHVLATQRATHGDFAVVAGVLAGIAVAVALLAALGPMPYRRSQDPQPPGASR
jgi:hypothetical protein